MWRSFSIVQRLESVRDGRSRVGWSVRSEGRTVAPRTVMATFVGVLVAPVAAAVALSDRSPGWGIIAWAGASLVSVAAIVVGVVRHRPSLPWPWLLLASSILASTGADVLYLRWETGDQSNLGLANALYLSTFVI